MDKKNPLRGEERRVVSTKLYRPEFANLMKICQKEGKNVNAKLREMVQREIVEKVGVESSEREDNSILTVAEMKEKALKIADSIPNLREKFEFMKEIRGSIIELFIIVEICFNQLVTATGKDLVMNHERKTFDLIAGKRNKKDIPRFTTKSRDMADLVAQVFPNLDEESKLNLAKNFKRFEALRDIFAHVPINWDSSELEFNDKISSYKHLFRFEPRWKNVFFALSEFTQLHQWIIDIILHYNRSVLLKQEIYSLILLGKSYAEIRAEANKLRELEKDEN